MHQYGGSDDIAGDLRVLGRYYLATNGRGIVYAEPLFDCNGDSAGTAFVDNCGICVAGNTGKTACEIKDCNNDINGTAFTDQCGECVGGNTGKTACKIVYDCNGDPNGSAYMDKCKICVGGNTGKLACTTGVKNISASLDIFPNPFENEFLIKASVPTEISITDVQGRIVSTCSISGQAQIGSELLPGLYFISYSNSLENNTLKLVKK
jgi:hypothetical protein